MSFECMANYTVKTIVASGKLSDNMPRYNLCDLHGTHIHFCRQFLLLETIQNSLVLIGFQTSVRLAND